MKLSLATLFVALFLFPDIASAQGLVGGVCEGTECSSCDIVVIANNFISWLIGAVMVLFAVLMVIAGFGLVTSQGNPDALNTAKSKFTNAIVGLIIVLSAWLIVDTIMRGLVGNNGVMTGYGPWSEIDCAEQIDPTLEAGTVGIDYVEGTGNTFGSSSVPIGLFGTAGAGIVSYAREQDRRQCLYSQANRNGCSGNPGYTDCSDLVNNAFQAAGCRSPGNTTANMHPRGTSFSGASDLRMGDAVVYRNSSNSAGHVVICVSDGCSSVIHSRGRGAPDGQPATYAPSEQLIVSNSSYYLSRPGARALRVSDYCPVNSTGGTGPQ